MQAVAVRWQSCGSCRSRRGSRRRGGANLDLSAPRAVVDAEGGRHAGASSTRRRRVSVGPDGPGATLKSSGPSSARSRTGSRSRTRRTRTADRPHTLRRRRDRRRCVAATAERAIGATGGVGCVGSCRRPRRKSSPGEVRPSPQKISGQWRSWPGFSRPGESENSVQARSKRLASVHPPERSHPPRRPRAPICVRFSKETPVLKPWSDAGVVGRHLGRGTVVADAGHDAFP